MTVCIDIVLDIAAMTNSPRTVWFIRIKKPCIAVPGQNYIIENFLEKSTSNSTVHYFKVVIKTTYSYCESIVYPFAQFTEKKNEFFIQNSEYFEIINFVEHMGMSSFSFL